MSNYNYPPPPGPPPQQGNGNYYSNGQPPPPPQNYAPQNPFAYPPQPSNAPPPPQYPPNSNGSGEGAKYYSQQYEMQNQQPVPNEPPPPYSTFDEKFAIPKPKWNDLWAAIAFIAVIAGLVVVSGLSLRGYSATKGTNGSGIYDNRNNFGLSTNTIILFAFVLGVSAVTGFGYLMIARKFTKQLIWITAIANVVIGLGTAAYYFSRKYYSGAIVFLIFSLFYAFCFWTWRSRIPFTVLMFETSIDVARNFGHVFRVSALGGAAALAAGAWFAVTFVAVYVKYTPDPNNPACKVGGTGSCGSGKLIGLLVFTVFGFYWLSEVIKNVMHTSVSGVYGSWYFCSRNNFPKRPTLGAFKRAMTHSFGSICFGSLLVSIIQLLKQATSIAQRDAAMEGDIVMTIVFCCLQCLIGLLEWLITFFNHYAYSYIALYGDAYIPAAKATWKMMKDRGFDALIADCLVDPVLTAGAVFVGYLCCLLSYLYLQFTNPAYNRDGGFTPVVMAFSFLVGLQVANVFLVPIKSGVSTIFVSMAHDPQVLMRDHSQLYQDMVRVYPPVQHAINQD